jgi:hypothetical protein
MLDLLHPTSAVWNAKEAATELYIKPKITIGILQWIFRPVNIEQSTPVLSISHQ